MKNNPCLMHAVHSLLDRKGWLQRTLLAQALRLRAWQDNTGRGHQENTPMAASSVLLAFLASLSSFIQFFSCMCMYSGSISLPPPPCPSPCLSPSPSSFHALFLTCSKGTLKPYSHLHLLFLCSSLRSQIGQYRKKCN